MDAPGFLTSFLDHGAAGKSSNEQRRIRAVNLTAILAALPSLGFAIGYALAGPSKYWGGVVVNVLGALGYLAPVVLAGRGHRTAGATAFVLNTFVHLTLVTLYLGRDAGFQIFFLTVGPVALLLTPSELSGWRNATVVLAPLFFVGLTMFATDPMVEAPKEALFIVYFVSAITCAGIISGLVAFFAREATDAEARYEREYARSEALLLNVLPPAIATRLKSGEAQVADRFSEVSVLFADLVGFTPLSAKLPPEDVVQLLNRVFTRFDELAEQFKLEKIKTIGDAYMVVGGLPEPSADHLERIAKMALAMNDEVAALSLAEGQELAVRIGIHTGPVVAGVIGKKKFSYDLWGDTVNTASRMESHGVPGEIQVTEAVKDRLRTDGLVLEPRGRIDVKGKGATVTFLLKRA